MFAVYASSFSSDDPLSGLVVGERPDPVAPDGWTSVTVKAASPQPPRPVVAARGGPQGGRAADDPRLRRRRPRRGRQRGARPRGRLAPRLDGRRDARPAALAALRAAPGHLRRHRRRTPPQRDPQARLAVVRGGRLPAHRVAHGVPHALRPGRPQGRRLGAGAGRRRRRRDRADRAGPGRRAQGAGHQPRRGQAGPGARDRRPRGVRVRRAAADEGRRGHGDRRPGHLVALDPGAASRRHAS